MPHHSNWEVWRGPPVEPPHQCASLPSSGPGDSLRPTVGEDWRPRPLRETTASPARGPAAAALFVSGSGPRRGAASAPGPRPPPPRAPPLRSRGAERGRAASPPAAGPSRIAPGCRASRVAVPAFVSPRCPYASFTCHWCFFSSPVFPRAHSQCPPRSWCLQPPPSPSSLARTFPLVHLPSEFRLLRCLLIKPKGSALPQPL